MPRKRRHDEHENLERWLVSYADFITLLFAFFVVMYAISSVNEGKYRVLSDTLTEAFQNQPRSMQPVEVGEQGTSGELTILDSQMGTTGEPSAIDLDMPYTGIGDGEGEGALDRIAEDFTKNLSPLIDQDLINVTQTEDWVEVEIKSSLLYGSGSAELEDEAIPILRRLAAILQRYPNQLQVEGFTDNLPISNYLFPSNWELSAARAAGVVNLFMRSGVDPDRMSAVGYGEFQPIADNNTAEGRSKNRRVVLVIMSRDMERRSIGGTRSPDGGEQG